MGGPGWKVKLRAGSAASLSALESQDHTIDVVPGEQRRSAVTMGLLWITMVTGFPTVLVGFEWFKSGITMPQMLSCIAISCAVLLAYSVPAVYLGAVSGQTYGLLSRPVFGSWGSRLVSCNLVWICIGWYGLTAFFLADSLKGLLSLPISTPLLSMILAVLMAVNNFFGFSGIANFARFLAAPVLIGWVGFSFFKALTLCSPAVLNAPPQQPFPYALTLVSSFVIGYASWGNEPDYWRYAKPRIALSVVPLVISLVIGQVIFPVTGWMLASFTGAGDYAAATAVMNRFAFGGAPLLAAIVLTVAYVAVNDSGLYGIINALENIREMPRKKVVAAVTVFGAFAACFLSGYGRAFEAVASLSCVFLPSATVIMIAEYLLVSRWLGIPASFARVPKFEELPAIRWPAVVSLLGACTVGVATSGVIPGSDCLHVGVASLQAWLTSLIFYLPLRFLEHRKMIAEQRQLLDKLLVAGNATAPAFYLHPGEER